VLLEPAAKHCRRTCRSTTTTTLNHGDRRPSMLVNRRLETILISGEYPARCHLPRSLSSLSSFDSAPVAAAAAAAATQPQSVQLQTAHHWLGEASRRRRMLLSCKSGFWAPLNYFSLLPENVYVSMRGPMAVQINVKRIVSMACSYTVTRMAILLTFSMVTWTTTPEVRPWDPDFESKIANLRNQKH